MKNCDPSIPKNIKVFFKQKKGSTDMYLILGTTQTQPTNKIKIMEKFGVNSSINSISNNTRTRSKWFQNRINHLVLNTNYLQI